MFQTPSLNRPEASWRNYVSANPASFATTNLSDDFNQSAHGLNTPTRTLARDATAYGTEPLEREWIKGRVMGEQSPTRPGGASGIVVQGNAP